MQLRIRMGRDTPVPSAPITNIALGGYVNFLPFFVDREAAASSDFTMVMEFTEPGVDPWTIRVANGGATVVPGAADQNDLVITQSPTAFVKTFNNIQDPMELIQAGDIKPSNFEGMKTFGALFPPPDPDRVWEALPRIGRLYRPSPGRGAQYALKPVAAAEDTSFHIAFIAGLDGHGEWIGL